MRTKRMIEEAYLKSVDQMQGFCGPTSESCPTLHVVDHAGFFASAVSDNMIWLFKSRLDASAPLSNAE